MFLYKQVPAERLNGLNGIERRYFFNHGFAVVNFKSAKSVVVSFGANGATSYTELTLKQVPAERLSGLNRFS